MKIVREHSRVGVYNESRTEKAMRENPALSQKMRAAAQQYDVCKHGSPEWRGGEERREGVCYA